MFKSRLDEYLEFDSSQLFFDPFVRVFGGAIRDIICGDKINDVDILVGSQSLPKIEYILTINGYIYQEGLIPKDLASIYSDIHVISEPHTWTKKDKVVQLIRPAKNSKLAPRGTKLSDSFNRKVYQQIFINLIENVDLSCCGVSWDGEKLYEHYPEAVHHCLTKVFITNYGAMYSERRHIHRKAKLESRGWKSISTTSDISDIRDIRIEVILNQRQIEYVPYQKSTNLELDKISS